MSRVDAETVSARLGPEVVGFAQDDTGVDVGCDGGRRQIRKAAGIDFAGLDPSASWMIAEVEMDEEPEFGFRHDSIDSHAIGRWGDGGQCGSYSRNDTSNTSSIPA